MLDVNKIRKDFPIYDKHPNLVYLDSGATSLKPKVVLDKMNEYYMEYGVNIHRGVYSLSYKATNEYENSRNKVAKFINSMFEEVVFTKNTTESLNYVALAYSKKFLKTNDEIIISELEHHSSILPWQHIAREKNLKLKYIPLDEDGRVTIENFNKVISKDTKVVCLNYVSNVMGYITPLKEIIKKAHEVGAIVIVDAAQAAPHIKIDVKALDCDFLAFSAHKMLGPTGLGILYGKKKIMKNLEPLFYGGDMIDEVEKYNSTYKELPYGLEAGTPPIAEIIGFSKAIEYLENIGFENISKHISDLNHYAINQMKEIADVKIYNETADMGIIAFNVKGVHPHDVATVFDQYGVNLRAGHHCAQLIIKWLQCVGTLRATFYIYNNYKDVDIFIKALKNAVSFFKKFEGDNDE
ncbi:MAG: SufS family cysteine desulfurase [Bacilli bacterium]|nr:SufS family cysteine desulfurase [Bacilli bacterium]